MGTLPRRDPEGDFIVPAGGDIAASPVSHEYSPLLKRIREGKRGADKLEECLTRGIRKARGQWITPRKRRNRGREQLDSPAPDLVLDQGPSGARAPSGGGYPSSRGASSYGPTQAAY